MAQRRLFNFALDPQMRQAMEVEAELAAGHGPAARESLARLRERYLQTRRYWNEDAPPVERVDDALLPGPHGTVPIRVYRPGVGKTSGAIVFFHGGGWVLGNLDTHDKLMRLLSLDSGLAVVGVDYRLSPEARFPIAVQECLHVAQSVMNGDVEDLDGRNAFFAGDSAGANLAAACATALGGSSQRVRALALFCGMYGLRDSLSRRLYDRSEFGLTAADLAFYTDSYLGSRQGDKDPRFDILSADLSAWPPTYIGFANLDVVADDSIALAACLERAGVEVQLHEYEGVAHGFVHFSRTVDKGRQAIGDAARFLRRHSLE